MSGFDPILSERLESVRRGVADAAAEAGRPVSEITTVVVTKFHPESLIRELYRLGVRDFGENRHQEAREKASKLTDLDLTLHFIGQIQGKKFRQIAEYADVVHSLDRVRLVDALGEQDHPLACFVQVNLTEEEDRGGVAPDQLLPLVERVLANPAYDLRGVMAVAPLEEEPRRAFARLRGYSDAVQQLAPRATAISAGMTHDYVEAIAEGATHLRIGTAITGKRPETV
ncbi:YggS family pyridoxal phosphate-dependent enzyme [Lysinibacter sp. HNR]|uniref:YggS family pyridoxal phosphate-dependent enzyme n=1 Tax=Lysinibacter sp. HNR TaxID=3031408 RepID=UPI002435B1AF|nr:YggS family pyridoxal phosphate-dependent enzyme [Lysinibacter sp. HNR]WGD36465.1 YggS family pyridoxal phosphate-dependent enzyme [Lysinibacter sp. HNR]